MKREPGPLAMSPYGTFETVMDVVNTQLRAVPYMLGDSFTVADVLWGGALGWTTQFGLVPKTPEIEAYIERTSSRPAFRRVKQQDAELAAAQKPS